MGKDKAKEGCGHAGCERHCICKEKSRIRNWGALSYHTPHECDAVTWHNCPRPATFIARTRKYIRKRFLSASCSCALRIRVRDGQHWELYVRLYTRMRLRAKLLPTNRASLSCVLPLPCCPDVPCFLIRRRTTRYLADSQLPPPTDHPSLSARLYRRQKRRLSRL